MGFLETQNTEEDPRGDERTNFVELTTIPTGFVEGEGVDFGGGVASGIFVKLRPGTDPARSIMEFILTGGLPAATHAVSGLDSGASATVFALQTTTLTFPNAGIGGFDEFDNDDQTHLQVNNNSGGALVAIVAATDPDELDWRKICLDGGITRFGPFDRNIFGSRPVVTYSTTSGVTVAAVRYKPARKP